MKSLNITLTLLVTSVFISSNAFALPMDWNGSIGFDTNTIINVRRTDDTCTVANGSQCIEDNNAHARFQSYVLRLSPSIIINDSATFKSQLSTTSTTGNFLGDDSQEGENGDSSAYSTNPKGASSIAFRQAYVELYADTGTYRVGKFSRHFGLGAVVNSGKNVWDRYFTQNDGIEAEFKLGKISVIPSWSKQYTNTNSPNGKSAVTESGIIAKYEDLNNQMIFGLYYGIRSAESSQNLYSTNNQAGDNASDITFIDLYFEKHFGNIKLAFEAPMMSGDIGDVGKPGVATSTLDAKSYIAELSYQMDPKWNIGLTAGMVSGDDASTDTYEAMYLHPNFKIASILYRYDYSAFNDGAATDVFNGAISNSTFFKLHANYKTSTYGWNMAFITATANNTAKTGETFYDHDQNAYVTSASGDQSANLGMEFDVAFDYYWNPSITITAFTGYLQTGDYFAFNQGGDDLELQDVITHGFQLSVLF